MGNDTLPRLNFALTPDENAVSNTPQRLLLIGQMLASGTATGGTLIKEIPNDNSWDTLFGAKSQLAGMVRRARQLCTLVENQIRIDVLPLDDAGGATQATGTVVFTGTATAGGTVTLKVGSGYDYTYTHTVVTGDTASDIATAIKALIDADTNVPVTAGATTGTLTLTASNGGTVANSLNLTCTQDVAGISKTVTGFSGGATDPTLPTLSTLLVNERYQGIAYPVEYGYNFGTDLLDPRFNSNNKVLDGVAFVADTDTLANHKTALNSENSENLNQLCNKTISTDDIKGSSVNEINYILATQIATIDLLRVEEGSELSQIVIGDDPQDLRGGVYNNSLPYFNTVMPFVEIIDNTLHWTSSEITEINDVGGSVVTNNLADNAVVMGEMLTTYKTDLAGNPDITWKFLNYRRTGGAIREYRFNNFKKDFSQSRMRGTIEQEIYNAFVKYYKVLASDDYKLTREDQTAYAFYLNNLLISVDFAQGTATVISRDPYVTQLREVNGFFKAVFNIATGEPVTTEEEEA